MRVQSPFDNLKTFDNLKPAKCELFVVREALATLGESLHQLLTGLEEVLSLTKIYISSYF